MSGKNNAPISIDDYFWFLGDIHIQFILLSKWLRDNSVIAFQIISTHLDNAATQLANHMQIFVSQFLNIWKLYIPQNVQIFFSWLGSEFPSLVIKSVKEKAIMALDSLGNLLGTNITAYFNKVQTTFQNIVKGSSVFNISSIRS